MPQSNGSQDKLYMAYQTKIQQFQFDDAVANVFSDMIKRSVPGYENIISMIGLFTQAHAQENTNCYDLGCSLGASTLAILGNLDNKNCQVIGVDNSSAMTERCTNNLKPFYDNDKFNIRCEDIQNTNLENASIIILNFTLQFIDKPERDVLMKRIYDALVPGGVLILSEKILLDDTHKNQLFTELHHGFKKAQGYSDLEISQKRTALETSLIPEPASHHIRRMNNAGFTQSDLWFQCLNFASFFAIKS